MIGFHRYKDGFPLLPSGKYRVDRIGDKAKLTIKNCNESDAGEITCEVKNKGGTDTASARCKIQSKFNFVPIYFHLYQLCVCVTKNMISVSF